MTAKNDVPGGGMSETPVSGEWQVGETILDRYEVVLELGVGGMGKVLKVHDRYWDMDFAVKNPRASSFQTDTQKENFLRECHNWMDLGLHNHIVTCHYVRVLGGIPRVFAEYVDGGNLKDWIDDGRLYADGTDKALELILDIAIQFAMGLQHAHDMGLIHQDVKPANVMMTAGGTVKLTDFGLANARVVIGEIPAADLGMSILASYGGMTPAYCSPEQADNAARRQAGMPVDHLPKLTRRTDLYSWAVSVLEMFTGAVTWQAGNVAGHALESYIQHGPSEEDLPEMPASVADLLRQCLQQDPTARPQDMNAVVDSLRAIYGNLVGKPYPREMRMPAREMADVLNNKALSYIELDAEKYSERAEALWREALTLDAHHPETTYNISVREWRAALIPVDEVVRRMEEVRTTHANGWRNEYLLGMVYLESGDGEKAVQSLEEAVQKSGSVPEVVSALEQARKSPAINCVRVFSGHTGRVSSVCLSKDGRWALSGGKGVNKGFDKTLRLWEVDTGKCNRVFEGHTSGVNSVCISVNGQWAISGGEDKMLRLWELATGQCLRVFEGHIGGVNSLCLSEDGRWALSGSYDNTLRLWDVTTGACVRVLKGNEFYWNVTSVCLSADGRWAVSGGNGYNKPLWLWDLAIGQCINVFGEFRCEVNSVCLSTDEHWVLSGGRAELRLWDLASGECLRVFEGHTAGVCSVCLSKDGRWALSGSHDKTLRLWEVSTGRCLRVFEGHAELVSSVCLSKDSRWALSGSWDGTLRLWNINLANRTYRIVQPYALSFAVTAEETTENERKFRNAIKSAEATLAIGRFNEALTYALEARAIHGHARTPESMTLWHRIGRCMRREGFRGGWHMRTFKGDRQGVNSVCMSADSRLILSSSDYSIYLWDVTTGDCLRSLTGNRELVKSVYLSPNGRWALSGSDGYNNTLCLWDLSTNESEPLFQGHNEPVCSVCLSADGRWALSISGDDRQGRTLRLWETTSGRCLRIFDYPWDERNTVCLSVDGLRALSTSDYNIHLWNVTTGDCIRSLTGNSELVNSICLSTDGRWALSASENMKLWNVVSGECVRVFESGWVNRICLSGDGRWALSASGFEDQLLRLWNVATGECVRVFKGHTGGVNSLCLSADGRWALSGSYDNTLRLWELDWDYEAMDPVDWDESARPYLENFLTLHTPYAAALPDGEPSEAEIIRALTREGTPVYTDDDFNQLLETLANAGYGWLRPEGVRRELEKMTMNWTGPPPIA